MTKPDLSRQSIIPSGNTASFDGSISIGEKLLVQDVEFVVSGITSGQTLVYNSSLNKLLPTSIDLNASSTLSGMTDVNFTTLVSGDTIVWNSATNKWENNNIVLNTDSIINTSTVTGSTTTNALDNLNTNKADLTDLYKLTNDFEAVTTSITLEASKMYVVFPLTTDILLTLPAHGINDTNKVIVIHKVDSVNIVTVAGYGVTTYLTDADDSVIYMSIGSVWVPFSWRNNASANAYSDSLITQTITNGVTDKSPSEDAVYDVLVNKADLVAGKVPTSQLPSYVDDVIEGYYYTSIFYEDSGHTITITGETSKIYIDLPTNLTYRWSGSVYIEISSTTLLGTTNRITVSGSTIDIASTYTGQTSIDTVGGITTGSWSGTPINDAYISSASTWNAKQNQLNGNGFVRATGTTIGYLSGTTNQFVKADGSLDSTSYISGSGLTTNRITKWDGTKLVNANSVDDGVTISSTINRTFTSDTSPINQASKFVFTGANTSADAFSFIKVALDLQVGPNAMGANAKGMLFLDGSISPSLLTQPYSQLYINSGGDIINDSKNSIQRGIYIHHRAENNGAFNYAPAIEINAKHVVALISSISIGAKGVFHLETTNADNFTSKINASTVPGYAPVHYTAYSLRDDAYNLFTIKNATVSTGLLNNNSNILTASTATMVNGFGIKDVTNISNSTNSNSVSLHEELIVQNVGTGTTTSGKRYRHVNNSNGIASAYIMGLYAGGVIIGNTTALPNASAALDVVSTTKGFLPPRMTNAQMTSIASPATGLLVYQTDGTSGLYQYNGTAWLSFASMSGLTTNTLPVWNGSRLVNSSVTTQGFVFQVAGGFLTYQMTATGTGALFTHYNESNTGQVVADYRYRRNDSTTTTVPHVQYRTDNNADFPLPVNQPIFSWSARGNTSIEIATMYQTYVRVYRDMVIGDSGSLNAPITLNSLTNLDLRSTTKGLGLNLVVGDLGTTRNGLVWYDTTANKLKGVENSSVINIVTNTGTETLTNKRITPRVGTTASSATPTINTNVTDYYEITGQTVDITSFTTNLTGTPVRGQKLWIDITGTAARAITWGASFEASTIALPTTTVTTEKLSVEFIWNVTTSKWRCVGTC